MASQLDTLFSRDAALFPHMLDVASDKVLLSRLSEADYRKASFLDQRIITPELARETVEWETLAGIALPEAPAPAYIFHIGHVGSTLLSRLLGELPGVLALREPHILRSLADISQIQHKPHSPWSPARYEARRSQAVAWLSRVFRPGQRSLIKASSFVSEIADEVIAPDTQAIFLHVALQDYLATIFAGDGSRQEARQLAGARLQRLEARLGQSPGHLWELSEGQIIALGWLTEMSCLLEAKGSEALWVNFDTFLDDPAAGLSKAAHHFGFDMNDETATALANGPIMRSYSKAPEYDYTPKLRRDLLTQARREHHAEISKAETWVDHLADAHPLISRAVGFEQ